MHVKKGDKVRVISGKDKGKTGVILAAYPKDSRVLVEGVNIVKKHSKPSQANPQGGIISQEAPFMCQTSCRLILRSGNPTRVGHQVVDGKKVRVAKSGEVLDK